MIRAATTEHPDSDITYTSNWPHEPLVGNSPTTGTAMWSMASIILLPGAIGGMVWMRVPGDIIFAAGGVMLAWFCFKLWRGSRQLPEPVAEAAVTNPA